ncbi:MAG: hypothetical protein HQK53_10885 [Oligoflexia bacterium]|nr:hypothetical protein [Oligoflexia bacterium]
MRIRVFFFLLLFSYCLILFRSPSSYAWDNHATLTYFSLLQKYSLKAPLLPAESLERFLIKEKNSLVNWLEQEEDWLQKNLKNYPPVPEIIKFKAKNKAHASDGEQLIKDFLYAIRINPHMPLPLYSYVTLDRPRNPGRTTIPLSKVSLLTFDIPNLPFEELKEGEVVSALEVVSSASDEPDYGMDIGLFSNNDQNDFNKLYAFGDNPFGSSDNPYASQAPFHLGYFHEKNHKLQTLPLVQRNFSEYRIHLFSGLAKLAAELGHPYWAFRFAGWALHYLQDLNQPYHASLFPGASAKDIDEFVPLFKKTTNQHVIVENYQYNIFVNLISEGNFQHPLILALQNVLQNGGGENDSPYRKYPIESWARLLVSSESSASAKELYNILREAFPSKYIDDPNYTFSFGPSEFDTYTYLQQNNESIKQRLDEFFISRFKQLGDLNREFLEQLSIKY